MLYCISAHSGDSMDAIYKIKSQWLPRKRTHYLCKGGIEKSVPRDHRLSSLGKPRDCQTLIRRKEFY